MIRRPYDDIKAAGPAANPIAFLPPTIDRSGRRGDVLCYETSTNEKKKFTNVLFCDSDNSDHIMQRAYWPITSKPPIETIMGHVSICLGEFILKYI
jgi:hypothetical protein